MQGNEPLVLTLCDDLFFLPRIEDAALALGYRFRAIENKGEIGIEGESVRREVHLTEPLEGPDATFIRYLVDDRPALIILDTAHQLIPWRNWLHVIKTSAATRRIPVIAFGSHVIQEPLTDASEAGADLVISRGRLQASLAKLMNEWAFVPDEDAILSSCNDALSEKAQRGIELIGDGKYYEAHEILEAAWQNSQGAESYLLRTLLQVSVIYLQIERGNFRGAMKILLRVKQWISPLPSECQGINVQGVNDNLAALRAELQEGGSDDTHLDLNKYLLPIPFVDIGQS
jgi:predicted metal-dependent hydrolase